MRRRSELTVPGHRPDMLRKAAATIADEVMADAEDACPVSAKGDALRRCVVEALTTIDWGAKFVAFRPNDPRSPWFEADLETVVKGAPDRFHGIILPKVRSVDEVRRADALLTKFEAGWKTRLRIEVLIETAVAVERAFEVATCCDRMDALIFGVSDYSSDIGAGDPVANQNIRFLFAKQRIVNAAKAAGLDAIDGVHIPFRDLDALRATSEESAGYGFDGRWAVHPSHLEIIHAAYTPSAAAIEKARRVSALWEKASGPVVDPETGEMIDEASVSVARRVLRKAQG